jgi:hypothetical protein
MTRTDVNWPGSKERLEIARAIAGGDPPEDLIESLPLLIFAVKNAIGVTENWPGRAELRSRLKALVEAAHFVRMEAQNAFILSHLLSPDEWQLVGPDGQIGTYALNWVLHDIATRAEAALAKVSTGPGRHKHFPYPDELSDMARCAFIVRLAWREYRGRWPGKNDTKAWNACERMWKAAGGAGHPRWGNNLSVWRDHLKTASKHRSGLRA